MPEGLLQVVGLLSLGYILLILELFVPGGIVGALGVVCMGIGCYLAFDLSSAWGLGSIVLSVAFTLVAVRVFARSRTARRLVLDETIPDWKGTEAGLEGLLGKTGRTLSDLRPAGMAEIDGERVDVVSDSEFLDAGVLVTVCEVEGNRVVVELVAEPEEETGEPGREAAEPGESEDATAPA